MLWMATSVSLCRTYHRAYFLHLLLSDDSHPRDERTIDMTVGLRMKRIEPSGVLLMSPTWSAAAIHAECCVQAARPLVFAPST